jgi:hypothetical protein
MQIVKSILVYKIENFAYNVWTRIGHVYLLGMKLGMWCHISWVAKFFELWKCVWTMEWSSSKWHFPQWYACKEIWQAYKDDMFENGQRTR